MDKNNSLKSKIFWKKTNIFFLITISVLFCIIGIIAYFGPQDEKGMGRFLGPWIFGFGLICIGFVWWGLKNTIVYIVVTFLSLILMILLIIGALVEQQYAGFAAGYIAQFSIALVFSIIHFYALISTIKNYLLEKYTIERKK